MKIKDFINNAFGYTPKEIYQFTLPTDSENPESTTIQNSKQTPEKKENVFPNINENLEYVKTKYNTLINSDIIVREFILNARGNQYKAFLLYIDGMVDSQILNDFVLESLMLRNRNNLFNGEQNRIISESTTNNVTIRKVKKFNLADYIESCLIPQNSITQQSSFDDIFSGINSGNCALFVDTLSVCFDIDVKGFKQRSISKPENEIVVKGPHEAFVENLRTNTSLLRRFTNNENLIIENIKVGKITKTNCAVCYIQNITNDDLVAEAKYRLNNLEIDSLLSAGELEQLLTDTNVLEIPKILVSERPDNAVKALKIKLPNAQVDAGSLSGGNQQKVVVAKWLARNSRVVIFDEPTRGIDVAAKVEIYNLMNQLKQNGIGVMFVSSEMPEVMGMSDRIIVMCDGRITGELSAEEATQDMILTKATQFEQKTAL